MKQLVLRVFLIAFVFCTSCAAFKSVVRPISDIAREMCEATLVSRSEVKAQAAREGLTPIEVAQALCALNDVIQPFLVRANEAGDQAVRAATRSGALRQ